MRALLIVAAALWFSGCYREIEVTVMGDGISSRGPAHSMIPPWTLPPRAGGGPHLRNDDECSVPQEPSRDDQADDDDEDNGSILPKRGIAPRPRGHEDNI
ncbi:MAG: hypothetical protein ACXVEE_33365 [Polyangiales bacterium]